MVNNFPLLQCVKGPFALSRASGSTPKVLKEPAHLDKPEVRGTGCSASGRVHGMETVPDLSMFGGVYQDDPARTLLPRSLSTLQERLGVNPTFPLSC